MRLRTDDDWSASAAQLEQQMLSELNARRARPASCGGRPFVAAPPLVPRDELRRAARHHSLDMAQRDYFDHCSLEGCDVEDRVGAAGWQAAHWAENIAVQAPTAAAAVQLLMDSPEHCQNIMDGRLRHVGLGYARGEPGTSEHDHYWTQVFAD